MQSQWQTLVEGLWTLGTTIILRVALFVAWLRKYSHCSTGAGHESLADHSPPSFGAKADVWSWRYSCSADWQISIRPLGDRSDDIELMSCLRTRVGGLGMELRCETHAARTEFLRSSYDEEKRLSQTRQWHTLSFYITTGPKSNATRCLPPGASDLHKISKKY